MPCFSLQKKTNNSIYSSSFLTCIGYLSSENIQLVHRKQLPAAKCIQPLGMICSERQNTCNNNKRRHQNFWAAKNVLVATTRPTTEHRPGHSDRLRRPHILHVPGAEVSRGVRGNTSRGKWQRVCCGIPPGTVQRLLNVNLAEPEPSKRVP